MELIVHKKNVDIFPSFCFKNDCSTQLCCILPKKWHVVLWTKLSIGFFCFFFWPGLLVKGMFTLRKAEPNSNPPRRLWNYSLMHGNHKARGQEWKWKKNKKTKIELVKKKSGFGETAFILQFFFEHFCWLLVFFFARRKTHSCLFRRSPEFAINFCFLWEVCHQEWSRGWRERGRERESFVLKGGRNPWWSRQLGDALVQLSWIFNAN